MQNESDLLLRKAAEELGPYTAQRSAPSTTMLRRARDDGLLELMERDGALYMKRAELERVKHELRCREAGCDAVTLGKRGFCEIHRGRANRGKSVAVGTRARWKCDLSEAEVKRRQKARREASVAMWASPAMAARLREHRAEQHAERRRLLERAKAKADDAGEVLQEIPEVAARVGRSPATVRQHVIDGLLQPDVVVLGLAGRPAYLFTEQAITDYEHKLAEHPDGRMHRFAGGTPSRDTGGRAAGGRKPRPRLVTDQRQAEEFYARWRQASGLLDPQLSLEAAKAEVRPTVRARRSVLRFNAGEKPKDFVTGWVDQLADGLAYWHERERLGLLEEIEPGEVEHVPTPLEICLDIAELDYEIAPKRWTRYTPAQRPDKAARRVLMAIRQREARQ